MMHAQTHGWPPVSLVCERACERNKRSRFGDGSGSNSGGYFCLAFHVSAGGLGFGLRLRLPAWCHGGCCALPGLSEYITSGVSV
jgi:hypothetical protein